MADVRAPIASQQFANYQQWVDKASSWLTSHPDYNNTEDGWRGRHFTAMCFDSQGRRCWGGADMMRARDEGAFPVWWIWPDQIVPLLSERNNESATEVESHG